MSNVYKLEIEIDKLQDQKLEALRLARESTGVTKTEYLEKFLQLNKEQEKLEAELARIDD